MVRFTLPIFADKNAEKADKDKKGVNERQKNSQALRLGYFTQLKLLSLLCFSSNFLSRSSSFGRAGLQQLQQLQQEQLQQQQLQQQEQLVQQQEQFVQQQ